MEYKKLTMGGYNLHLINTDKFKTCHVEVIFRNNINIEEITRRAFLSKILVESSADFPTKRSLLIKLEDLYNASIYSNSSKVGGSIITNFAIDFLAPEYTEKTLDKESIKLLFDIIMKPLIKNREFDNKTFELVKKRMKDEINITLEDASKLSIINALKCLGDSPSSYSSVGSLEDLEEITAENLYETYEKMLKNDYIDIFVIGNISVDDIAKYIKEFAKFKVIKNHSIDMYVSNPKIKEKYISNKFNFQQTNLVVILNLNNLTTYEKKYVANLYNTILGGGSLEAKLYKSLRKDNSLCYSAASYYQKYDGLIIISTGVNNSKSDKAIKLIKQSIKDMSNSIEESELEAAKELLITSLNYIKDNENRIIDNYYYQDMKELDPIEERIKIFKKVSVKDIYALSKKISISVVYALKGGNNE